MNRNKFISNSKTNRKVKPDRYLENHEIEIRYIMDHFDFTRVLNVMKLVDWQWTNADRSKSIPTMKQLRATAKGSLMRLCSDPATISSGTGGFTAYWDEDEGEWSLGLRFTLNSTETNSNRRLADE